MGHPRRFGHLLVMSGLRVTSEVAVIRSPRGEAGASGNALTHGHVIDELRETAFMTQKCPLAGLFPMARWVAAGPENAPVNSPASANGMASQRLRPMKEGHDVAA